MMEDEVVRKRAWLTHAEFLDYLGATNLIPGPNSTELAIHIGHRRAGWRGLIVAGACFIFPAALIVSVLAAVYVRFGTLPAVAGVLYGVKPVVIAVVVQALFRLARSALETSSSYVVGIVATVLAALGINEIAILVGAGALMGGYAFARRRATPRSSSAGELGTMLPLVQPTGTVVLSGSVAVAAAAPITFGLWPLFGVFLKIGSVLFGSGYVLLAFLRSDLVERLHWLTERQLLDAVAVGQVTPGPVFTTATFIGYVLGGSAGAGVATLGIFLPAFVFVALSGPLIPRLRKSHVAGAMLDGVNVASLALMAVVSWELGRVALVDLVCVIVAVTSAVALITGRVNTSWLVVGGAVVGVLAHARL
jgi:chromate transporter